MATAIPAPTNGSSQIRPASRIRTPLGTAWAGSTATSSGANSGNTVKQTTKTTVAASTAHSTVAARTAKASSYQITDSDNRITSQPRIPHHEPYHHSCELGTNTRSTSHSRCRSTVASAVP